MPASATVNPPAAMRPATRDERWRSALADRLGLQVDAFQAARGAGLGLPDSSPSRFLDALPTSGAVRDWSRPATSFARTYGAVVANLTTGDVLRDVLGPRTASWQAYSTDRTHLPIRLPRLADGTVDVPSVLVAMFQTWALGQLDGTQVRAAVAVLRRPDLATAAATRFLAADGVHEWSTSTQAITALGQRPRAVVVVDGDHVVRVSFSVVTVHTGRPLAAGEDRLDPTGADSVVGWFDPAALRLAHADGGPAVWRRRAPTWDDTFAEHGALRRVTTGVVVADGIEVQVTPRRRLRALDLGPAPAEVGPSPWSSFAADGCGEGRPRGAEAQQDGDGWSSPLGAPRVIGVLSSPIEALLASPAQSSTPGADELGLLRSVA